MQGMRTDWGPNTPGISCMWLCGLSKVEVNNGLTPGYCSVVAMADGDDNFHEK